MIHYYLVLPAAFALQIDGTVSGANVLTTAQTKDGRWCVSLNAVNEFPAVFEGKGQTTFTGVWLSPEDFPAPDRIPGE